MVKTASAAPAVVPAPGTCPMGGAAVTWGEARAALAEAAAKVPDLFAQVRDPKAHAVGVWNVEELAVHMTHGWAAMPNLARRDVAAMREALPKISEFELGTPAGSMLAGIDQLHVATVAAVKADPERDLGKLGERIRTGIARFCDEFDGDADPSFRPWIAEPITAPPPMFAAHVLFETLIHSYDLAKAAGLPYVLSDRHAEVALRGFILPMLVNLMRGRPGPKLAIDMRLAGSCRITIVYTGNGVALTPPGRRVDSHLWIRPSALLLLMWHRRSLASVVARRESLVWGRRPWTALEPLKAVPNV
jgi:hypothetical protein